MEIGNVLIAMRQYFKEHDGKYPNQNSGDASKYFKRPIQWKTVNNRLKPESLATLKKKYLSSLVYFTENGVQEFFREIENKANSYQIAKELKIAPNFFTEIKKEFEQNPWFHCKGFDALKINKILKYLCLPEADYITYCKPDNQFDRELKALHSGFSQQPLKSPSEYSVWVDLGNLFYHLINLNSNSNVEAKNLYIDLDICWYCLRSKFPHYLELDRLYGQLAFQLLSEKPTSTKCEKIARMAAEFKEKLEAICKLRSNSFEKSIRGKVEKIPLDKNTKRLFALWHLGSFMMMRRYPKAYGKYDSLNVVLNSIDTLFQHDSTHWTFAEDLKTKLKDIFQISPTNPDFIALEDIKIEIYQELMIEEPLPYFKILSKAERNFLFVILALSAFKEIRNCHELPKKSSEVIIPRIVWVSLGRGRGGWRTEPTYANYSLQRLLEASSILQIEDAALSAKLPSLLEISEYLQETSKRTDEFKEYPLKIEDIEHLTRCSFQIFKDLKKFKN